MTENTGGPPPQGRAFLLSLLIHVVTVALLGRYMLDDTRPSAAPEAAPENLAALERQRVFLPPPGVLRQLAPTPIPTTPPRAAPTPAPPPASARDRISIGPPSAERADRLLLRREDDLTANPGERGAGAALPKPTPPAPKSAVEDTRDTQAQTGGPSADRMAGGLRLPPGAAGREPASPGGDQPGQPGRARSLAESLRQIERHLPQTGPPGVVGGRRMGPLFFDPAGADFTAWVNQFKNEVYRNWIVPQSVLLGFRGHVDIDFVVERDGRISDLRVTRSSGTPALDRAAANALLASRLQPLPPDYGPARLEIQVSFFYNETPQGS